MCNVSKMVNQIFNAQIIIYTTVILLNYSISVYFLYMQFSRVSNRIHSIELLLMYELGCVLAALKIPIMSYDCEKTMRQVKTLFFDSFNLTAWANLQQNVFSCYTGKFH